MSTIDIASNVGSSVLRLLPIIVKSHDKGEAGVVGIFGGTFEYTSSPYFAGVTALRCGADVVHVFCTRDAGTPIKVTCPDLIVHPILDDKDALTKIQFCLDKLHVVVIGPSLDPRNYELITAIFNLLRVHKKLVIIDGDGLHFIAHNPNLIKNYPKPGLILTPNVNEYEVLLSAYNILDVSKIHEILGDSITIIRKSAKDDIITQTGMITLSESGSPRRCRGQGDMLVGCLASFCLSAFKKEVNLSISNIDRAKMSCLAACKLIRECNKKAYKKKGRGMICSDMIEEVTSVFKEYFEMVDSK